MKRQVEAEWLDSLPVDDPGAVGSRRDLGRLNGWMGHRRIMARALRSALEGPVPRRIVEVGAGDGGFMLRLARRLSPGWPDVAVALVDQQEIVAPETRQAIAALGWPVESVKADVLDWLGQPLEWATQCSSRREEALTSRSRLGLQELEPAHVGCYTALDLTRNDAVIANLFLHHFEDARLAELLRGIARIARVFIAVEPRRSRWALACSRQLWAIGCNRVTRHDAPVSVRAGFAGNELSRLWPTDGRWSLEERAAGCFSHLFIARLRE